MEYGALSDIIVTQKNYEIAYADESEEQFIERFKD